MSLSFHRGFFANGIFRYGFLLGVILALVLAGLFPEPGAPGGWLRTEWTTGLCVFLIFLIQGLILPTDVLWRGLLQWRLHVYVHGFLFLLFPVIALAIDFVLGEKLGWLNPNVRLGFLFLAILPTTISTCVAFTAAARGNVPGALFNATVSNVAAIVIVPVWIFWILGKGMEGNAGLSMIGDIAVLVLLPLALGQVLRPWLKGAAERRQARLRRLTNAAILFILYAAFARSVASGFWAQDQTGAVISVFLLVLAGFVLMHVLAWQGAGLLRFSREDRLAAFFCAPQKSLAMGIPMGQLLFADRPDLSLILLPLMVYHAVQLLAGGYVVSRVVGGSST